MKWFLSTPTNCQVTKYQAFEFGPKVGTMRVEEFSSSERYTRFKLLKPKTAAQFFQAVLSGFLSGLTYKSALGSGPPSSASITSE